MAEQIISGGENVPTGGRSLGGDRDMRDLKRAGGPADLAPLKFNRDSWYRARLGKGPNLTLDDAIASFGSAIQPGEDHKKVIRYWPWLAAEEWRLFYAQKMKEHIAPLRPTDVRDSLKAISSAALSLSENLSKLRNAAIAARDDGASGFDTTYLIPFLKSWIVSTHEPNMPPLQIAMTEEAELHEFIVGMAGLSATAKLLGETVPAEGRRTPSVRGIGRYVTVLGAVWVRVTGKKLSASRSQKKTGDEPPFVVFCKEVLSRSGNRVHLTQAQIERALVIAKSSIAQVRS